MVTHLLTLTLALAVPMEIERMRAVDDELRAEIIAAHTGITVAELLGSTGDQLLHGGPDTTKTFAAVARGLACLAWTPGGVTFDGMHFCAQHELCEKADAEVPA